MDKCSRRIVGWSLRATRDVRLTVQALDRAVAARRPRTVLIFHTDRGIEYAAYGFRARLARLGFVQSMNRPQHMNDNSHMESFFHSMKADAIHGVRFTGIEDLREAPCVTTLLFTTRLRLHSSLNYVPPATFEKQLAPLQVPINAGEHPPPSKSCGMRTHTAGETNGPKVFSPRQSQALHSVCRFS